MPQSDGDYQCSQRVFSCVSISIPGRDSHRDKYLDWTETAPVNEREQSILKD